MWRSIYVQRCLKFVFHIMSLAKETKISMRSILNISKFLLLNLERSLKSSVALILFETHAGRFEPRTFLCLIDSLMYLFFSKFLYLLSFCSLWYSCSFLQLQRLSCVDHVYITLLIFTCFETSTLILLYLFIIFSFNLTFNLVMWIIFKMFCIHMLL